MKNTVLKKIITTELAVKLAELAIKKAEEIGISISVSVLDSSANEVLFMKMDNAPLISIETAKKKSKMAVGFGIPTGYSWYNFIKDDPILMEGAKDLPGFILLGGGSPIIYDGAIIGSIGVSGGHYKEDELCVNSAFEFLTIK